MKCDITYLDDSGNGVVYTADGKVRGDFNTKADEGTPTESHMIQDGEFGYIWSGNQGTKIKVDTTEASPTTGNQQLVGGQFAAFRIVRPRKKRRGRATKRGAVKTSR